VKACGQAYLDEQGHVQDCSEEAPCRKCLSVEVKRLERALGDAGERAASLERVIRHLRDGDSVMEESR
jgi:hypothetical protein